MTERYILDGKTPVPCPDLMTWARWFETADRIVALSEQGDVRVSTVFLGLDHRFFGEGPPILFESMVFIAGGGGACERYSTWEEAEEGHKRWVAETFRATPILALPESEDR